MRALGDDRTQRERYALCGPEVYTLRDLVAYVGEITGHRRPIVPLSPALGRLQARLLELLPGKLMSRDNLASMQLDSVCDGGIPHLLGSHPTALEAIVPQYLAPATPRTRHSGLRAQGGR
jgi:NADH dehydrogenase